MDRACGIATLLSGIVRVLNFLGLDQTVETSDGGVCMVTRYAEKQSICHQIQKCRQKLLVIDAAGSREQLPIGVALETRPSTKLTNLGIIASSHAPPYY